MKQSSIWVGWDPRESAAYMVALSSLRRHCTMPIPARGVILPRLRSLGLYNRPTERRAGRLWDVISDAPMSTEHACARFLVPHLAKRGWALFCDGDMLFRKNIARVFDSLDPSYAVYCVKHDHEPELLEKMDGQIQTRYARKNWSSFMIFNCDHPANQALTVQLINEVPGRDLHAFCWLDSSLIGGLDKQWNYLVGDTVGCADPAVVHFTSGTPDMPGYENSEYAEEWRAELDRII